MSSLKFAFRALSRTPFVTGIAVLSLALGIGANAAIYSIFDQMLLQSLPVVAPDELVNLSSPGPKSGSTSCGQAGSCDEIFSYPMFKDLQAADTGLSGLAAHVGFGANLAADGKTISGEGMLVSGSYFPVLGVRPELGRLLGPEDEGEFGGSFVAVLSYDYWSNDLGGDPGVLNRPIVINGHSMTVVGVAGRGFTGTTLGARPDVFVPVTMRNLMQPWGSDTESRVSYWAYLFGRRAAGVSIEQASDGINGVYTALINEVEAPLQDGLSESALERFRARTIGLEPGFRGQSNMHRYAATPLTLLLGITGSVLLIACANIANLLLARGAGRSQEMAIRGSLGASRWQLLAQLLGESLLLAVMGGVASLVVARWTLGGIVSALSTRGEALDPSLRLSMVLFAAGVSLAAGLIFGLYPALFATGRDLVSAIKSSAGQPSGSRAAARFRGGLVVAQLALSTILLVSAGLFIKSMLNVSRVDLGLETEHMVVFGISPELNGYEPAESAALFERVEQELAALPGVDSVSAGMVAILQGSNWGNNVSVEGFESGPDVDTNARFNSVGPGYFSTLGIPLIAGREFDERDTPEGPKVAVINEAFAEKFGLDPRRAVGKRMATGETNDLDMEIVGVVENAKYSEVKQAIPPLFFTPYRQSPSLGFNNFYVRTQGDPDPVLRAIAATIGRLDANLPVEELKTLAMQARESVSDDRTITILAGGFATLATILAAVGLYGVLAYSVAQRTREIGLRMALGADGRRVRGMVVRQVARLTLIGGAIGILGALGLGKAAESLLYEMSGNDPVVVAASVLMLLLVALGAAYVPAFRASRIDPMKALRFE